MKTVLLNCAILLIGISVSCQSQPKFEKTDPADLDPERVAWVTELSDNMLKAQRAGGFYPLTAEEATEQMITGLNETVQKQAYGQLKAQLGEYQGLELDHMMRSAEEPIYEVYRFRGHFGAGDAKVEVRAVTNADGKLAGFYVRPWKEEL